MKPSSLGALIALLLCGNACAVTITGYSFTPSDANVIFSSSYKFRVEEMTGYVTSAELFVSPAALPIWDNLLDVWGGEGTTPLLSEFPTSSYYIGERYIPRNLLFHSYWGLDVTEFMRGVTSPYVQIDVSGDFTKDAYLRVTTLIPEPSSSACAAISVGALLFGGQRRGRLRHVCPAA